MVREKEKHGMEEALRRIAEARRTRSPVLDLSGLGLEELPDELWKLTWLERLDLSRNRLTALPPEIGQLQNLQELDLGGNRLTALPPEIGRLQNLQSLLLWGNRLTALSPEITQLQNLQDLNLGGNRLTALSPEIGRLQNLQSLLLWSNRLTALPPEITQLQNLRYLDLSFNRLTALPSGFSQLQNLQYLNLWSNQLTALPSEIIHLQNLRNLDLSFNQLTAVPPEIARLQNLRKLNLAHNQLTLLPPEIGQLQNLQSLNLWGNQLTALPPEITRLRNLQELSLADNQFIVLPPEITRLQNLQYLNLSGNQLTTLPPEITRFQNLRKLNLAHNQLTVLPPEIGQLQNLQYLDLSGNQLTALPPEITRLQNLRELSLADNRLTVLPPEITRLQKLQYLDLSGNQLIALPPEITRLQNLQELNLADNQLTVLPPEIARLQNLQYLNLSGNQLGTLPPEIGQLQNLQRLVLSFNRLTALPPEISQLQNLQELNLSNNQLTALPPEMTQLCCLKYLYLHGNPLTLTLPRRLLGGEILGGDAQAILRFYRAVWERGRPWGEVRVLFVGQPGVGKTSLVRRLTEGTFREDEPSTLTVETHRLPLGEDLTGRIWDLGVQEFMHATHPFFFQGCVYVLVLNVRYDMEHNRVRHWLDLIRAYGGDSPILIVGNHADADQHVLDLPENALRRRYPTIRAFLQTSAKEGTGIAALRQALREAAASLPHVRVRFAAAHLAVRDALEAEKGHRDLIPRERYAAICREQGIDDEEDQATLLELLHDLGVVLDFRDERGEPLVPEGVLNPNWVTEAVYRILTDQEVRSQSRGRLTEDMVARILPRERYQAWHRRLILRLMQQFELAYPAGGGVWWIPRVMPQDEPEAVNDPAWQDALAFEYAYEPAFYESIITRFIVRTHEHIAEDLVWRYGVVLALQDGANRVLVRADRHGKRVEIRVTGRPNTRRGALAFVREHFDAIHATFARGKGETSFRVTAYLLPAEYPGLRLNYDDLLTFAQDGVEWFPANWRGRTVRIRVWEVVDRVWEVLDILRRL